VDGALSAQRIHVSERTYYALMQSGKQYAFSKRGQIILKVLCRVNKSAQ